MPHYQRTNFLAFANPRNRDPPLFESVDSTPLLLVVNGTRKPFWFNSTTRLVKETVWKQRCRRHYLFGLLRVDRQPAKPLLRGFDRATLINRLINLKVLHLTSFFFPFWCHLHFFERFWLKTKTYCMIYFV